MTADVDEIFEARTWLGQRGGSLPIIIVQAASLEVLRFGVTDRTLIRCNWKKAFAVTNFIFFLVSIHSAITTILL